MKLQDIISAINDYQQNPNLELIQKAYSYAREHHAGQTRSSGEPYITHVTEVAYLATKLRLDDISVAASLLHDTVEDTDATLSQIEEQFGAEVSGLVDAVTKLSQVQFSSRAEVQAENFRKMLVAMSKDIRVLLIKLCDRLHNMSTLEFLSESRQQRISQETLDIYAPLAHRLGIYWMKSELEDYALRFLKPDVFNAIKDKISKSKKEREIYIEEVVKVIKRELAQNNINADVYGRPKHFYSIYQKMEASGLEFHEIYDLIAFRIIVQNPMSCYAALGVLHAAWKPIPGRFKDFIAMAKANGYQSLHTTVIGPRGFRIEIQIRTKEMHDIAEKGIAAHWTYKQKETQNISSTVGVKGETSKDSFDQFAWLRNLIESEKGSRDPLEFLSNVKDNLFSREVYCFSPKGDIIALPANSTPVDFAFAIHTAVGNHCTGAKVNGQQVPITHRLQNGDTIEITTSEKQHPVKDWLGFVASAKAKQRIRSWLKTEERERSTKIGRDLLTKDLRKISENLSSLLKNGKLNAILSEFKLKEIDSLFAEIGYGKITCSQVIKKLFPDQAEIEKQLEKQDSVLRRIFSKAADVMRDKSGVRVSGLDGVVFRFAKCCEPLPGDILVGYITRGRGVAIHKRGCNETLSFDPQRIVDVSWEEGAKALRRLTLAITCSDKVGILAQMTQAISSNGANIVGANVASQAEKNATITFEINIDTSKQLEQIIKSLENISGVLKVERKTRKDIQKNLIKKPNK